MPVERYCDRRYTPERAKADLVRGLRYKLRTRYNMTIDDYEALKASQENRCAICRVHESELKRALHIDHDHATGRVRGLVCFACNTGMGKLGDDPALLRKAADYLEVNR